MHDFDGLYQEQTLFDQLWLAVRRPAQRARRRYRDLLWPAAFVVLALVFLSCAAGFLFHAIVPTELSLAAQLAQLGSALLAFGVAHHFLRIALSLCHGRDCLPALLNRQRNLVAMDLVLFTATLVVVPLTLYVAFASHALLGVLLTLAFGMAAQQLWQQALREGRWWSLLLPAPKKPQSRNAVTMAQPLAVPAAAVTAARTDYLRELRQAGVNVRIAKILVAAGFASVAAVRAASDADILRVHGVGAATLRRLRRCCGGSDV